MEPTKPFTLDFETREGYLRAHIRADDIDRPTALEYLSKIAARAKDARADKLMLVREIPVMMSDSDVFFTTQDFLQMIGTRMVAFVNPYLSIEKEMDFAILIGANRGGNYRLFTHEPDAEAWLLQP